MTPLAKSLAMGREDAARAAEESLTARTPIAFPKNRLTLRQAAMLYLSTPQAPNGMVKKIAEDNYLKYESLLGEISRCRDMQRFA